MLCRTIRKQMNKVENTFQNNNVSKYTLAQKPISVIKGTAMFDYVSNVGRGDDAVTCSGEIFDNAVCAFQNESAEALCISQNREFSVNRRFESMRPFIIKILLYIDIFNKINRYAVIAYMIESLATHPNTDINRLIEDVTQKIGIGRSAVIHMIERCFDVYDQSVADRITYLTSTKPVTAKDAMCDIALFVRTRFYNGARYE